MNNKSFNPKKSKENFYKKSIQCSKKDYSNFNNNRSTAE